MIAAIELKILAFLNSAGLGIRNSDIKKGKSIEYPAVFVFTETGKFRKLTQRKYKCELGVFVLIAFRNVKSEKKRRHGLYPILEGVIQGLMLNNLELDIDPLIPQGFRNITDKDMQKSDVLAYQLEFSTAFTMKPPEEKTTDLLAIGLEYYLQDPVDDSEMDARDEITLQEE
ncbi:MAG: DUF1834 family protein [Desulfobacula sp.]|nr:DUF1834 family protein [Desulfobacula sp.]